MTNLESNIEELRKDLRPLDTSREVYLSLMVKSRIEDITDKYNKEFDKLIIRLRSSVLSDDITDTSRNLRILSRTLAKQYSRLLDDYEKYAKFFKEFP